MWRIKLIRGSRQVWGLFSLKRSNLVAFCDKLWKTRKSGNKQSPGPVKSGLCAVMKIRFPAASSVVLMLFLFKAKGEKPQRNTGLQWRDKQRFGTKRHCGFLQHQLKGCGGNSQKPSAFRFQPRNPDVPSTSSQQKHTNTNITPGFRWTRGTNWAVTSVLAPVMVSSTATLSTSSTPAALIMKTSVRAALGTHSETKSDTISVQLWCLKVLMWSRRLNVNVILTTCGSGFRRARVLEPACLLCRAGVGLFPVTENKQRERDG